MKYITLLQPAVFETELSLSNQIRKIVTLLFSILRSNNNESKCKIIYVQTNTYITTPDTKLSGTKVNKKHHNYLKNNKL